MALAVRGNLSSAKLRAYARRAPGPRVAARAYALTNALEGTTRAEAARLVDVERQVLREAVLRFNAEGLLGLEDRSKSGRSPGLSEGEQAALAAIILRGPDPARDGISAYTHEDLARIIAERVGRHCHPSVMSGFAPARLGRIGK